MSGANGLLAEIARVGADPARGGYSRHVFAPAELELREWFVAAARERGLSVHTDRNANIWAWLGEPGPNAVVTGSHLDSVPGGGAFDGPLGVVSALAAVDELRAHGFSPRRPLAVVVFAEEEGGRYGVPCLGSRLLTGAISPERVLALRDGAGDTFADAAQAAGFDPQYFGPDAETLRCIGTFVELHVEQGRGLIHLDSPIAVGSAIIAHGRWRFSFSGQGNHAGTTLLADRRDPMLPAAELVAAARRLAASVPDARATVGRIVPTPGGTNVIASRVDVWLDARVPEPGDVHELVREIAEQAGAAAEAEGCTVEVREESFEGTAAFDPALRDELVQLLDDAPVLPTGAGHDAAVLAPHVPTAMLYVRNPSGISHSPEEYAEPGDIDHGARELARVLKRLAG
ncbi:allantoate amidohydrolase [Nocardia sp. CDC159]|uniref:Allantoate amidohydrolase n=1 Tax=Nocardia pulmonis TaxID=2951408 RepID=A0A9X2J0V0_9NOCA|nr:MULTISPECIES: allantoate amidohydrolase [Nocardia]MCM6776321.1 allantoate amidohydrolase [Nocardia pulmonis]MCM6788745.1 allantoate amidohydrolase [Nocardia sp. CDC159]